MEMFDINRLPCEMVIQLWTTMNTRANWRLLWIDTRSLIVSFCIDEFIVRRVQNRVTMLFVNEWKKITMGPDRKTIIWQLFR